MSTSRGAASRRSGRGRASTASKRRGQAEPGRARRRLPRPRVPEAAQGATGARNLAKGRTSVLHWRDAERGDDGPRAPRLRPDEVIGRGMTRVGRFRGVDPLRTPDLWGRWSWLGLVAWGAIVAGSGRRAWRQHGGLPRPEGDGPPAGANVSPR